MFLGNHSIFHALRQLPRWLLAIAMLAMLLQSVAVLRLPPQDSASNFHAEICTSTGLVSQSDGSPNNSAATHDCCSTCAFNAPLLASILPDAVPPAPTFKHAVTPAVAAVATATLYLFPPSRAPPQA
jgi:hypothetical protein